MNKIPIRKWQGYPEWFNPRTNQYEPIFPKRVPLKHIVKNSSEGWRCQRDPEHKVDDSYHGKTCPWCEAKKVNSPLIKIKVS